MTKTLAPAPADGWGLDDFLEVIGEELPRLGIEAAAPDRRTVRYYATIGALDKPGTAGREARYAERHLAQVLALKRLQAEGIRLAAIQTRLAHATTAELIDLATGAGRPSRSPHEPARPAEPPAVRTQSVVVLAPGVQLVLDDVTVSPTEAHALTKAARGLLTQLTALGLDTTHPRKGSTCSS